MKKKLVASLAVAMVLGVVGTSFAASNPFADVPAHHWSYDSIIKLSQAGIIDGYADGKFQGDKTVTRYEMAQIVAKAMTKEDKANAEQKALIEKLAAEYKTELDNLGVRVGVLEKKSDKFSVDGGTLRMRFDTHKVADNPKTTDEHANIDVSYTYKVNDRWAIKGESEYQRSMNSANLNSTLNDQFEQMYATGPIGATTVKAGRFGYTPIYGLIYDDKITGGQVTFGNEIKATITAGKATSTYEAVKDQFGNVLYNYTLDSNGNVTTTNYKAQSYSSLVVEAPLSKVTNAKVGFIKIAPEGQDYRNYWTLGFDGKIAKDWSFQAAYVKSNASNVPNSAYWGKVQYKVADYDTPGTYDIFAYYRKSPTAASYSNTDDWVGNVKGYRLGFDYVFDKNIGLTAWYTDAKNIDTDAKDKKYRAEMDFKF
jgi:hypothetical protein